MQVQKGPEEEVQLEVYLANGKRVAVDIVSTDQTEEVLETVGCAGQPVRFAPRGRILCSALLSSCWSMLPLPPLYLTAYMAALGILSLSSAGLLGA